MAQAQPSSIVFLNLKQATECFHGDVSLTKCFSSVCCPGRRDRLEWINRKNCVAKLNDAILLLLLFAEFLKSESCFEIVRRVFQMISKRLHLQFCLIATFVYVCQQTARTVDAVILRHEFHFTDGGV